MYFLFLTEFNVKKRKKKDVKRNKCVYIGDGAQEKRHIVRL